MQKLHLVGFTTDHKGLILSARRGSRSGGFVLEVSDELAAAVEAVADHAAQAESVELVEEVVPPRPQSALSVRELQARLRAGRSIEAVAAEAGVDADWVSRFAAPVLAEQARVIDATRQTTYSRPRLGRSALPIGPSVYRNLVAKGVTASVEELNRGWSARLVADGRWVVTFSYSSRGRRQRAVWEIDLRGGQVVANDRMANQLAFVPGAAPGTTTPSKATAPVAADPTDVDRANARRGAEARTVAEAQLAEAARKASKRSAELARRAGSGKRAAPKAKVRAVIEELPAPPPVEEAPPVASEPIGEAPSQQRAEPAPETLADPAVRAVAAVREAAQALLSDFASGALAAEPPAPPRVLPLAAVTEPPPEPEPEPEREPEPEHEPDAPPAPAVEAAPPPPPSPRPRRAVDRAVELARSPAPDGTPRGGLRFRDDLATAAARNGDTPQPAEPAPPPVPRPRRSTPLRAR